MMSNGLLADGPREYSDAFGRRWLVTNYEAGDVVLHTPYTVSSLNLLVLEECNDSRDKDPRFDYELRSRQRNPSGY